MSNEATGDQPVIEDMPQTAPDGQVNRELVRQVHPQAWVPKSR